MTIVGLGLDATDIPRIAATIERYGDRFLERILTEHELAYCRRLRNPAPSVAGRLALWQKAGGLAVPLLTTLLAFLIGGLVVLITTGKNPLSPELFEERKGQLVALPR